MEINSIKNITWQTLKSLSFENLTMRNEGLNLPSAQRTICPFTLSLAKGEVLRIEEIVRIVPGKRLVVFGIWRGKAVAAKLFFDRRRIKQELLGIKLLKDNKVPTPSLLYQGRSADKRVYVMISARIVKARSLTDILQTTVSLETVLPVIHNVLVELATQHVLGIKQNDLHLNNFLIAKRHILTLDGADITLSPQKLPKKESMENVALFISQLGVLEKNEQIALFHFYAKTRGWLLQPKDTPEFLLMLKKWQELRWQKYQKKIMRSSSHFAKIKTLTLQGIFDRRYVDDEFVKHLYQPESFFRHESAQVLKEGRSSTVIRVDFNQQSFVIKRYNIKNMRHFLRRTLRRTRAYSSWRIAHKLNLFNVATATPVAFLQKKLLGFSGTSYYITRCIEGVTARQYFAQDQQPNEQSTALVKRILQLLKQLFKLEITHGDLKITNILIDSQLKPMIIDFDGAVEHASLSGLHKAWRYEIERFLLNFDEMPAVKNLFLTEMISSSRDELN